MISEREHLFCKLSPHFGLAPAVLIYGLGLHMLMSVCYGLRKRWRAYCHPSLRPQSAPSSNSNNHYRYITARGITRQIEWKQNSVDVFDWTSSFFFVSPIHARYTHIISNKITIDTSAQRPRRHTHTAYNSAHFQSNWRCYANHSFHSSSTMAPRFAITIIYIS